MRKLADLIQDVEDTAEDYTPIDGSGTYPMWQVAAKETADKLEKMESIDASLMAGECRWYQETIASWSRHNRPDDATRRRIVNELITLLGNTQKILSKPRARN